MMGRYQAGDVSGAYESLFEPTGLDWRTAAEAAGPGVVDQGIKDAATFVEGEAAALVEWDYGVEQATMIDCPVLSWCAASENPINPATRAFLYELFPQRGRSSSRVAITSRSPRTRAAVAEGRSPNSSRATVWPPRSPEVAPVVVRRLDPGSAPASGGSGS